MNDVLLQTTFLHKHFGAVEALKGISLKIRQGEIFGLLGPNGAGKTTAIAILTGLTKRTSGEVLLEGREIDEDPAAAKRRMGFVPQELALYPVLSARENLRFFGGIYGLRGRRLKQRIDDALALTGLADRADHRVATFSGGMKRRLNIAAALLHEPRLLFLDEPTVGVDPQSRNAIFEGIEALNRQGTTVLYTTHYMEEAERLCHRVAILDEGKILAMDSPAALTSSMGGGMIHLGVASDRCENLARDLMQLGAVETVTPRADGLQIELRVARQALVDIVNLVHRSGVDLFSIRVFEPSLEAVFLRLTGKRLRD